MSSSKGYWFWGGEKVNYFGMIFVSGGKIFDLLNDVCAGEIYDLLSNICACEIFDSLSDICAGEVFDLLNSTCDRRREI